MRKRWLLGAGLVLVVVLAGGAASRLILHHLPWASAPDRVTICDREFGHVAGAVGSGPYTRDYVQHNGAARIGEASTIAWSGEIWGSKTCGTGVFLRVGDDRFLGYGLLGGP